MGGFSVYDVLIYIVCIYIYIWFGSLLLAPRRKLSLKEALRSRESTVDELTMKGKKGW